MANPFVHVELNTPDPEKAKTFYSQLFQWQLEDVPNPAAPSSSYTMIKVGSGTGGGIMRQIPGGPSGWLAYVEVDDIQGRRTRRRGYLSRIRPAPFWGCGRPNADPYGVLSLAAFINARQLQIQERARMRESILKLITTARKPVAAATAPRLQSVANECARRGL